MGNSSPTNIPDANCPICRGAGFIHPRDNVLQKNLYDQVIDCECRGQYNVEHKSTRLMKYAQLPTKTQNMTFDNYEIRMELEASYKTIKELGTNTEKTLWLTIQGGNDVGKTHLAVSILRHWLNAGKSARYSFVPLLLGELKQGFSNNSYDDTFQKLKDVDLLLLDDLGTESSTGWVNETLESLIDYRSVWDKSIIVTTNKVFTEFSPRLSSRLIRHQNARVVAMVAPEFTKWKQGLK